MGHMPLFTAVLQNVDSESVGGCCHKKRAMFGRERELILWLGEGRERIPCDYVCHDLAVVLTTVRHLSTCRKERLRSSFRFKCTNDAVWEE